MIGKIERITRRLVVGGGLASVPIAARAAGLLGFRRSGGGAFTTGPLTTNVSGTRPLGSINSGPNDYPFANVIAAVSGGPGNPGDYLVFWSPSTGEASTRWYLNNSPSPPVSGLSNASNLQVPSVPGSTWNPGFALPPTPVTTNWTLRFVSGGPSPVSGTVIASQPITIDILKRTSVFPALGIAGGDSANTPMLAHIGAGIIGGAPNVCPIVSGVIGAGLNFGGGSAFPPNNTIKVQYLIDDVPVGPIVTGPAGVNFPDWLLNINTANVFGAGPLADGTHYLGILMIDTSDPSASFANENLPYFWRCVSFPFIVHNTGASLATIYAGPQVIPSLDRGFGPSFRTRSSKANWLTFPGFTAIAGTNGTNNTVVPLPLQSSGTVLPMSDPSSPYHSMTAAQQRNNLNWVNEGLAGASNPEYYVQPRFFTTVDGGVYAYGYNPEEGQTLEGDYNDSIKHFNFDGLRNNSMPDPISQGIDGHDGTYWVWFELFGRIVKYTHAGALTTLAGVTTNRALLGLNVSDSAANESTIGPYLTQVGTIGSPSFGDLRGINDGCFDLTATAGDVLIVSNPVDHIICKVTGLLSGPVVMTRICGQDGGLGGAQTDVANNGGYVDGPATEFIAGSSVATFNGTVSGNVLTVNSGFAGTLSPGCPLSWSGNLNTATGHMVVSNISGSGNGSTWNVNFASSGGAQSMTASTPVALLAGPYSVKMADGVRGPDPAGTLYFVDYQNSALRKISTAGIVTTIFGNQTGALKWALSTGPITGAPIGATTENSAVSITSATWANTAGGQLTVNTSAPVVQAGVASGYGTIQPGWTITLGGLTNSGSGGAAAVNGNFSVVSVGGGATSFVVAMPAGAGVIAASLGLTTSFTGQISGQFLSVSAIGANVLAAGTMISGAGVTVGTFIVASADSNQQVGGAGGAPYFISPQPQTVASETMTASAGVAFWADDVYLPVSPTGTPRALNRGGAQEAYCPLPQRLIINSTGKLVLAHTWFDCVSTVDLTASTIVYTGQHACSQKNTRLNANGSRGDRQLNFSISWFTIDVDSGVAGDVSAIGCVGPKDDVFFLDANGNITSFWWRCGADGSGAGVFITNDSTKYAPLPVGRAGSGHYNWGISISRTQGRMLSSGLADTGVNSWRLINPAIGDFFSDPLTNQNVDGAALPRGFNSLLFGTLVSGNTAFTNIPGVFPWGTRPTITTSYGDIGRGSLGLPGHADTFDGVVNLLGTPSAIAEFIKNGFGSVDKSGNPVGAPEWSIGGDDCNDALYAVQRMSAQGSLPSGVTGGGFTAITPLVQRAPYATDVTAPVISGVSAIRTGAGATTILVTWTTDKPCWGIAAAGFASAHGTAAPYHLFAREAFVAGSGNPSYGTSHSVTLQCFVDQLTYVAVIAKDIAGNNAVSLEQTVAA